jgi:hypothetical protein
MRISALVYEPRPEILVRERAADSPHRVALCIPTGEVAPHPFTRFGCGLYGIPRMWRVDRQQIALTGQRAGTTGTGRLSRLRSSDAEGQQKEDLKET